MTGTVSGLQNRRGDFREENKRHAGVGSRFVRFVKNEHAAGDAEENGGKLQVGAKKRFAVAPSLRLRELRSDGCESDGKNFRREQQFGKAFFRALLNQSFDFDG